MTELYTYLYLFYFIGIALLALTTKDNSRYIYLFSVILLLLIVALKPFGAYPDDSNYLDLLTFFRNNTLPPENQGRDYFYYYFAEFLSIIFGDKGALIAISLIGVAVKSYVIGRMSKFSLAALLTYVAFCIQLTDLTALRTSLSTAFIFLAIYFFSKKAYIKVLISYILSFLSHIQTILLIPVVLVLNKYLYKYRYLLIPFILAFGLLKLFPLGELNSTGYPPIDIYLTQLNNGLDEKINLLRLSTVSALFILLWIDYRNKIRSPFYKQLFMAALLSQLSGFLFYWFPVMAGRLADLLLPFLIIYFALTFRNINIYQKIAIIFISFMININYLYVNPLFMRDDNPLAWSVLNISYLIYR